MSKNLTRKGLAFGALVALSSTLIAGSPASAAGLYVAGYVNLAPTLGTASQLNTLQAKSFDLTGSFAGAAATGGSLKFLVTDADKVIKADVDVNASTAADATVTAYAGGVTTALTFAAGVATLTGTTAPGLSVGDQITIAGAIVATGDLNGAHFVTEVDATAKTIKFATTTTAQTATLADVTVAFTATNTGTANATQAQIAAAPLGSRSVLGATASIKARATDGSFVVRTADTDASGSNNVLRLVSTAAADTSATATVTAWIDNNDDDIIDTGDYVSETKTVKFLKNADVTFVTELDAPIVGTQALTAYVSATPDINLAQLGASNGITVLINMNGAAITSGAAANANYDSVSGKLKATATADNVLVAGTYKAQASYDSAERGAAVYQTPETATKDISSVSAPAGVNSSNLAGTAVLTGTKTVTITSAVKSWTTYSPGVEAAVAAGVKAKVTVTKVALASASVITAGGKTLASTGTSIEFETTTNADGKVVFDLVSNNGTKTDSVSVVVSALDENTETDNGTNAAGTTQGWKASSTTTLLWQDATVATNGLVEVGTVGYATSAAERNVAKGGSVVLNYELRNNFGALVTTAGYRVALTVTSPSSAAATATVGTPLVTDGKVSFTVVDQTVGSTGYYSILATLQKLNTAGTLYDAQSQADTVKVNVGTAAASSVTVPASATTGIALSDDVFVAQDLRLDANTNNYTTIGYAVGVGAGFTVNGVVRDATGAPVAGAPVVVAAKGLALVAANAANNNDATLAIDTITVYTSATGEYSVVAFSHTAGDVVISVTSGAATKSVTAKFAYATTADKDTKIAITGSDVSSAGRTNNLVVAMTDKWGNAIKGAIAVSVSHSGAGYLASYPTAVSAVDGKANLVLITGANDSGTATITVTYDVASSDTDVVATKVITVGAASVVAKSGAVIATKNGRVYVTVNSPAGFKSYVKVGFSTKPAFTTTGSKLVSYFVGAGKRVAVVVFVRGGKVASQAITIK